MVDEGPWGEGVQGPAEDEPSIVKDLASKKPKEEQGEGAQGLKEDGPSIVINLSFKEPFEEQGEGAQGLKEDESFIVINLGFKEPLKGEGALSPAKDLGFKEPNVKGEGVLSPAKDLGFKEPTGGKGVQSPAEDEPSNVKDFGSKEPYFAEILALVEAQGTLAETKEGEPFVPAEVLRAMKRLAESTPHGILRGQLLAMVDGGMEDSALEDLVAGIFNGEGQVPRESSCPSPTKATKGAEDSADQVDPADLKDLSDAVGQADPSGIAKRKERLHSKVSLEFAGLSIGDDDEESNSSSGSGSKAVEAMAAAGGGDEVEDGGGEDSVIKRRWREPP